MEGGNEDSRELGNEDNLELGIEDMFDAFLSQRGHQTELSSWEQEYNKKQCPECGGLHNTAATECSVCGWSPYS